MVGSRIPTAVLRFAPRRQPVRWLAALSVLALAAVLPSAAAAPAPSARPRLVADTPAACNVAQPKGFARCFAEVRTPADGQITPFADAPPSTALGPPDIQDAYKLPDTGGGQTVAIVDAFGYSTAEEDLAVFRSFYGLSPCTTATGCFTKVDQRGGTDYPTDDAGWAVETALDLDAVSSACPRCNILLVEADNPSLLNLGTAVNEAVALGAKYVSNSYGTAEFDGEQDADTLFYDHKGVAVTASSGDSGYGTNYPSSSQFVTAVGGTRLTRDTSTERGWTESVWGSASGGQGGGSGCSPFEAKPAGQNIPTTCDNRATADISADADPASGLAIYDTLGQNGWLQVGGTSLSSPLTAAMFALAGTPDPDTYPSSYPYHDPNRSAHLFDITTGANGACGTVLCTAGTGWDGPTGLGTPNGVAALTSSPQGSIAGRVTEAGTGKPVADAVVSAEPGEFTTRTGEDGSYRLSMGAGVKYDLSVKKFSYQTATATGVDVTEGATTTADFELTPAPSGVISGTVLDGSGHGWPLHARVSVADTPVQPVWTDPATGRYSLDLPQGDYTLDVSTDYPGYPARQVTVSVGDGTTTENLTLAADMTACTAPGYGRTGLSEDFAGWAGAAAGDGWTLARDGGPQQGWRFDDPGNRPPPANGSIPALPGTDGRQFVSFDPDDFAVADAAYADGRQVTTTLTSPQFALPGGATPQILFNTTLHPVGNGRADVQLSTDAGRHWSSVWQRNNVTALGPTAIPIPSAAGKSAVQIRFTFTGRGLGYWAISNVFVGNHTCAAQPGGLLTGIVTDKNTGEKINGAQVSAQARPQPYPWPEGISLGTADPGLPAGVYWLFTPAGGQQLTAAASGYDPATTTVSVPADQVTRHDWALTPAGD